jgi:phosphoglycolate phosphatase-like HAD superfamily hydrolase
MKPSPEPALIVAAELGVPPDACALVGDSPSDVVCARAAGMQAAAVTWGYRPRAELVAAEPKWLAETPADLGALV